MFENDRIDTPIAQPVGTTVSSVMDEWTSLTTEGRIWVKLAKDYPVKEDEAGPIIEVEPKKLCGYYCVEHWLSSSFGCSHKGCGFTEPQYQLSLAEDFYWCRFNEIKWSKLEGLDMKQKKWEWASEVNHSRLERVPLVQMLLENRLRMLEWQEKNNQWFYVDKDTCYWRTPSKREIKARRLYYLELLHLIRNGCRHRQKDDALKYNPLDT